MLPQTQRLHTAADFRRVRGRGRQWRSLSFLAFVLPAAPARMGVIVSAKIGKAVVRKRAARILRAAYAQIEPELAAKEIVFIARPMIKGKTSTVIVEELRRMSRGLR
jgi:ribonuclease P protein component